jgi:hypothetical protein
MRIPNYLRLAPSGIWHSRQRLPSRQASKTGKTEVTRSLRTRDLLIAQQRALDLVQAYAQAFTVRGLSVVAEDSVPTISEIRRAKRLEDYKLIRRLDGTVELEVSGEKDHALAMDALERIGPLHEESYYQEFMRAAQVASVASSYTSSASNIPSIAIGKAVTQWLTEIKPSTKTKTFKMKTTVVEGFARHYGEKNPVKDAGRVDVGNWVMALRASKLEPPTIVNKLSYLRGFFDWAKVRGYYPAFAKDENPAAGQVIYGMREKRQRRSLGFKPFSREQVQALYDTKAMEQGLSEAVRWGAWIGLYTGARVAEIGQLTLADFVDTDGIPCLRICEEAEGQSSRISVSAPFLSILRW